MAELMICGIDHGNGNIKTEHTVFPCGLVTYDSRPELFGGADILKYKDKYYTLSDTRMPYRDNKTTNDDYFILTLFALVKEAKERNERLNGREVVLACGLPPADFSRQAKSFKDYFLSRRKNGVQFEYNDTSIIFYIRDVVLAPQDFAAVIALQGNLLRDYDDVYCIDIGDGTVDLLKMHGGRPDLSVCVSNPSGIAVLRGEIRDNVQRETGKHLTSQIESVLLGRKTVLSQNILDMIDSDAAKWTKCITDELHTTVPDFTVAPTIILGGGQIVLRKYLSASDAFDMVEYIDDIKANAIGYAAIARTQLGIHA